DPAPLCRFHAFLLDGRRIQPSSVRVHKGAVLLKLPGVDSMDAALALKGKDLYIARADAPEGMVFDEELLGMEVFDGETGAQLGEITAVEPYPAHKVYTVQGSRTYRIPAVPEAFILSVNLERNRMDVRVWEGMADDEP
ncbi:MAG: 16S rRNA processing protein RimM, partial [Oscillibacter sp.]|nr:16S rRNA processing protein RimM [Oscillibacter sp.]